MIISDEDDTQKIKDPPVAVPTIRLPERAASRRRPFSPLPDYETSQALTFRDFNESQVTLYKPPRRRILDSRLWRAAIVSLVVYIFLTLVIGVPIIVHKEHDNEQKYPYSPLTYALVWPSKNPAPYSAGSINNISSPVQSIVPVCNNWTTVEYFDSPNSPIVFAVTERYVASIGQFSFSSNASCFGDLNSVQGAFYTGINPNETVQDAILSIIMQSSSPGVFNRSFACAAIADNFTDLSLYVPDNLTPTDRILYNITLLFPQNAIPSRIDSFATVLPMFDQRFGFFGDMTFDQLSIEGAVSRVTVDSIQTNRLLVDTSLEPVVGTFHANTSLVISTIMAPVVANISLYNDPQSQFPTTLDVHTGNSNLTANITILAPNKNPPLRPNFIANLRTFSGSLSTAVLHDPTSPPTALQLHAFNDLGSADVTLDNLFEGVFQVSTKQAVASVTQGNASVTDPWVPGLPRTLEMDVNTTARSFGWIGWGNMGQLWNTYQQGEVLVDSSLADVTLSFLG